MCFCAAIHTQSTLTHSSFGARHHRPYNDQDERALISTTGGTSITVNRTCRGVPGQEVDAPVSRLLEMTLFKTSTAIEGYNKKDEFQTMTMAHLS